MSYSRKGVLLPSRCLLESPFLEPLLRTLLRTLLLIKTHCKTPSENPSGKNLLESNLENPSKNPSEKAALLHAPVGVRPSVRAWIVVGRVGETLQEGPSLSYALKARNTGHI